MEILEFKNRMSEKDLQITYLTKDLHPECIKNSSHSTIRKPPNEKWAEYSNNHQRRCMHGK